MKKYIEERWEQYRKEFIPSELQDDDALQISKEHFFAGAAHLFHILYSYGYTLSSDEKKNLIKLVRDELKEFDKANRDFWKSPPHGE